ncbi:MAG: hypothetical protein AAF913_18675, partial [Pseudomonadota bacterium]
LTWAPVAGIRETWTFPAVSTERLQLEAFAEAITAGTPYPIALEEVVQGVAVFEAVPISAVEGRRIAL